MGVAQISYGAALSGVLALLLVRFAARERRLGTLAVCVLAAVVMPVCWNAILAVTGTTDGFSHDLPFRPFPISFQDTGSGVFTLAGAGTALGLIHESESARRVSHLALWTALAALLVDIYFY
jgi:hypothetical protein